MTNLKDAIYDIQELITNKEEIFNDEIENTIKIDVDIIVPKPWLVIMMSHGTIYYYWM